MLTNKFPTPLFPPFLSLSQVLHHCVLVVQMFLREGTHHLRWSPVRMFHRLDGTASRRPSWVFLSLSASERRLPFACSPSIRLSVRVSAPLHVCLALAPPSTPPPSLSPCCPPYLPAVITGGREGQSLLTPLSSPCISSLPWLPSGPAGLRAPHRHGGCHAVHQEPDPTGSCQWGGCTHLTALCAQLCAQLCE